MFQIYLACSVYLWSTLFSNNLLGHCTCTTIILAYKIMCSQELYVPGIHVAGWKQVWWFNHTVLGTFHPIAEIMMNPRYRNFTIHEIQIQSIAYDVIYAYNLKNQHFPFNRNIFMLMSHPILKHFCRCWHTVISLLVEFGSTHFSNFHSCCYNNLYINMENGSYFVRKKLTLVYKVLKEWN